MGTNRQGRRRREYLERLELPIRAPQASFRAQRTGLEAEYAQRLEQR